MKTVKYSVNMYLSYFAVDTKPNGSPTIHTEPLQLIEISFLILFIPRHLFAGYSMLQQSWFPKSASAKETQFTLRLFRRRYAWYIYPVISFKPATSVYLSSRMWKTPTALIFGMCGFERRLWGTTENRKHKSVFQRSVNRKWIRWTTIVLCCVGHIFVIFPIGIGMNNGKNTIRRIFWCSTSLFCRSQGALQGI